MNVHQSRQGHDGGPSTSYQMVEEEQRQAATEPFPEAILAHPAEVNIEVVEVPSPPQLPQQDENVPASSLAGEVGTMQPQGFTIEGNRDLETALINCQGAVTRLAKELCGALQDFRRVCQAAKK